MLDVAWEIFAERRNFCRTVRVTIGHGPNRLCSYLVALIRQNVESSVAQVGSNDDFTEKRRH
jgi:hypothetical protein